MEFIVQASSRAWSGEPDLCMRLVEKKPIVYWTILKILDRFLDAKIVIAAPSFDQGSALSEIAHSFDGRVDVFYGHDDSPLSRLIEAHERFLASDHFVRVDGLNMFFLSEQIESFLEMADKNNLDCIKFPDDYPAHLTFDIYKKESLLKLRSKLNSESPFVIHPKYAFVDQPDFSIIRYNDLPIVEDDVLLRARDTAKQIYLEERQNVTHESISKADMYPFHYQLATHYIKISDSVLDIACGDGFGAKILAPYAAQVTGADLSEAVILLAKDSSPNINFEVQDVTQMSYSDEIFDVVTSFETVEHIENTNAYLSEIHRVLKPGGLFILSTPQNSLGHIPINAQHLHEYSLVEIKNLISTQFDIVEIKGIKQGCIILPNDPIGNNTFMVAKKDS